MTVYHRPSSIPAPVYAQIGNILATAPVDVAKVAATLGLAIYQHDLAEGISGALLRSTEYKTPSGFVIFVRDSEAYVRQRFTAAHEIGHFVLHRDRIGDGISDNYLLRAEGFSNWMETQANQFAADLLMPYPLLEQYIQAGHKTVPALAKAFGVSEVAMSIRIGSPT